MTDQPLDLAPFEDAEPETPDLEDMPAVPAVDPGPDGDLTIDAPREER